MDDESAKAHNLPVLFQSNHYIATPCRDCDLPGYVILRSTSSSETLSGLPNASLDELGPMIATLEYAIRLIVKPQKIYILRFSEGLASVHFHIFPRTEALAVEWLKSSLRQADQALVGEDIFSWARRHYRVAGPSSLSNLTLATAGLLRDVLSEQQTVGRHKPQSTSQEAS